MWQSCCLIAKQFWTHTSAIFYIDAVIRFDSVALFILLSTFPQTSVERIDQGEHTSDIPYVAMEGPL